MLKKDLTKKKTIHIILVIFIFLATMFIAGSLNNMLVVTSGTKEYMEIAGMPDYVSMYIGDEKDAGVENNRRVLESFVKSGEIEEFKEDSILWIFGKQFSLESGEKLQANNTIVLNAFDIHQQKFFTLDGEEITEMEEGSIYLIRKLEMGNEDLKVGDVLTFTCENGDTKEFVFKGYMKDAFFGSSGMGNSRIIIHPSDFDEISAKCPMSQGKLYSVKTSDVNEFINAINKSAFLSAFYLVKSSVEFTYIMDMIVGAVYLLVSLCLIVTAILMLRFTIVFTINENYKEIGIMKAIGLSEGAIRRQYANKYFFLAMLGATPGFVASIYFSKYLLSQSAKNIVIRNEENQIWLQAITSLILVLLITGFAYLGTGKVKKMTPLAAINKGNTGERFQKKGMLSLSGSKLKTTGFLAINDVLCDFKKYIILVFTSMVGIWLVAMSVNTINTLASEKLLQWFQLQSCDFFVTEEEKIVQVSLLEGKEAVTENIYDWMKEVTNSIEETGYEVEECFSECGFRIKIYFEENSYECTALMGIGTNAENYEYIEGVAPAYGNEIALSHVVADFLGAKVGDTVYILDGEENKEFLVTAVFQSMMNMGEMARVSENVNLDYPEVTGCMGIQYEIDGEYELEKIENNLKEKYPEIVIVSSKQYATKIIGDIMEQLENMKIWIVVVVILINILVVSLMEKIFIIKDRTQIALLKTLGFGEKSILMWQLKRIVLVLFAGILLGSATGTLISQFTAGEIFKMMGLSKMTFEINPIEVYIIYPIIIFVFTVLASFVSMLKIRNISERELSDIE